MQLRRLSLTNFRCYRQLDLELPPGPVLFTGRNAQGKTSLLEAVYVLATSRAPGSAADRDLVHWDAAEDEVWPYSRIWGELQREDGLSTIEVVSARLPPEAGQPEARFGKRIRVNDAPRRAMDLLGLLRVVLFTPQDLRIVDGAPAERRRFLDGLLCQVDPGYCRALARYNQVLAQRNSLLRQLRERRGQPAELDFWDQRLVQDGALLLARRQEAIAELQGTADRLHGRLAGGGPPLEITYRPALDAREAGAEEPPALAEAPPPYLDPGASPAVDALGAAFARALEASRPAQLARGLTLVGPHRDDFGLRVGRADMRGFGSRGQQRTVALALKLAEARLMQDRGGEAPVILLDDVLSELDAERRAELLGGIAGARQTFLTATELTGLPARLVAEATRFHIEAATVTREG